jgi:multiple sugar transport system substrate-binding protein
MGMQRRLSRLAARTLIVGLTLTLTACSGSRSGPADSTGDPSAAGGGVTRIKLWAWYPEFKPVVDHFNATHTNIQVDWTNAGTGGDQYTKLQTALKAGKGAPDVVMLEFQELPTISLTKHLVDMGKYGANNIKDNYVDWAWKQSSDGDKVYAIPVDAGPMGMLYREDLFRKYKLTVPKTWAEFKTVGQQLKAKNPKAFMANFGPNDAGFMHGLFWQAGSKPYRYSVSDLPNIGIKLNDPPAQKVMAYWDDLFKSGLADTTSFGTTDFYNGLSNGKYATYLAAGWGPGYLQSVAKKTAGKWRAAPLPQWTAGENAQGDWGGSAFSVTDQSAHPKEATQVAMEIFGSDKAAWKIGIDKAFLFPTSKPILEWDYFRAKKWDFFGGQEVNGEVFVPASAGIGTFDWTPFNDYVYGQLTAAVGQAITKKSSFVDALNGVQATVSGYAQKQGFKVTS